MAWTPEDYQEVKAYLKTNPGDAEAARKVAIYEAKNRTLPVPAAQGLVGNTLQPEGIAGLEGKIDPAGGAARAEAAVDLEGRKLEEQASHTDPTLPSASKDLRLYRPPEAMPKTMAPGLEGFMQVLPSFVGGGTEHWPEPSLFDFTKATGKRASEDSEEYKRFADERWMKAHDAAVAAGRPIVRAHYMKTPDIASAAVQQMAELGGHASEMGAAATLGADKTMTGGLLGEALPVLAEKLGGAPPGALDRVRAIEEGNPASVAGGVIGGAMLPGGLARQIASKVGGLLGVGETALGSALRSGAAGAAGAAGAGLVEDAVKGGADLSEGRPAESLDPDRLAVSTAVRAAMGGLPAALAGAASGAGEALRDPLRSPLARDLAAVEDAGGKTSFLSGIEVPPGVRNNFKVSAKGADLVDETGAPMPGVEADLSMRGADPTRIAAAKVAPTLAGNARARVADAVDEIGRVKEAYYATPEAKTPVAPKKLGDAVFEVLRRRTHADTGEKLAFTRTGEFKKALNDLFEVDGPQPSYSARTAAEASEGKARIMSAAEAARLGFDVPSDATQKVVLRLKPLDAQRFEEVIDGIDYAAKAASAGEANDPAYEHMMRAAREDRDKFPWAAALGPKPKATLDDGRTVEGWSALHTIASRKLSELEDTLRRVGVQNEKALGRSTGADAIRDAVTGFRAGPMETDEALADLANGDVGTLQQLKEVAATRSAPRLMASANLQSPAARGFTRSMLHAAQLRLDPTMSRLGRLPVGGVAAAAANEEDIARGARAGGTRVRSLAQPVTSDADKIRRLLKQLTLGADATAAAPME